MSSQNYKRIFSSSRISDETGAVSSKRFIAIFCVLVLAALLFWDMWCPNCKRPTEIIVDALNWIAMVALGSSSADKFSIRKNTSNE
jgi:tetrahydromethanopterin S-methyltransferase subunit E